MIIEDRQLKIFEIIYLYIIIMLLLITLGTLFQKNFGIYGIFLIQITLILFPVFLIVRFFKLNSNILFKFEIPSLTTIYNNISMWMTTLIIIGLVSHIQLKLFPNQMKDLELINNFFKATKLWQQLLLFSLTPAICEEFLFRGLILGSLKQKMKPKYAIIFSGILFGIFHIYPGKILTTALLGMLFAYSAHKTKSLLMPMILHFFNNAYIFILIPYTNQLQQNKNALTPIILIIFVLSFNGIYQFLKNSKYPSDWK
ncbi:MAG: CPBP family intramembrane metalloprotease [Fusobacteriaceae bacterium]|jgi:sodium transport system permease protein|nr:CPBP family intramembrane metalloprotease [Fusobacteriaceae bacterium]